MTIHDNPNDSPQTAQQVSSTPRTCPVFYGAIIGFAVGLGWGLLLSQIAASHQSEVVAHMISFPIGLTITGIIVAIVDRLQILIGLLAGTFIMYIATGIVGPSDGWIGIWIILYGGSGVITGPIIGMIIWLIGLRKKKDAVHYSHNDDK